MSETKSVSEKINVVIINRKQKMLARAYTLHILRYS